MDLMMNMAYAIINCQIVLFTFQLSSASHAIICNAYNLFVCVSKGLINGVHMKAFVQDVHFETQNSPPSKPYVYVSQN